jgi:hypothetical protein
VRLSSNPNRPKKKQTKKPKTNNQTKTNIKLLLVDLYFITVRTDNSGITLPCRTG